MIDVDKHFDQQALRERLFNDADLIKEIAEIFLEDTPLHIAELISQIRSEDCDGAKKTAHKIKGAAANMSAEQLQAIARTIEIAGEQKDILTLGQSIPDVENAYSTLEKELKDFLKTL